MKLQKKFKLTLFAGLGLMMGALGFADGGDGSGDDALTAAAHPVFTAEQAEAGEVVYQQSCAACHFGQLQGDDFAAALAGGNFRNYWSSRTLEQFLDYVRTQMPLGQPGTLSDEAYAQVVAYILDFNGYPAGEVELATDPAELSHIMFGVPAE